MSLRSAGGLEQDILYDETPPEQCNFLKENFIKAMQ